MLAITTTMTIIMCLVPRLLITVSRLVGLQMSRLGFRVSSLGFGYDMCNESGLFSLLRYLCFRSCACNGDSFGFRLRHVAFQKQRISGSPTTGSCWL